MLKNGKNIVKISNIPDSCREVFLNLKCIGATPLKRLGVFFAGISQLQSGYEIGLPEHNDNIIIIFTQRGVGIIETKNELVIALPNTVSVIPASEPCRYAVKDDSWDILWFHCNKNDSLGKFDKHLTYQPTAIIPRLVIAMNGYLLESSDYTSSDNYASEYARIISQYIVLTLSGTHLPDTDEIALAKLFEKVKLSLSLEWKLSQMAKIMNVSPATLQRRCQYYYHKTPHQILISMRMEYASNLLTFTNYPLKTIAQSIGYSDEFVFSAAFHKFTGISPYFFRHRNAVENGKTNRY